MSLKDKISEYLKESMKSGDKIRTSTLRSIRALILEFEKSGANREMNSEEELKLLTSAAKKRKESIEQFRNAGRNELAEQEEAELKILEEFLPAQLSEEEIFAEVKKIAGEIGANDKSHFSLLMPKAIQLLKGKADGKVIRDIVDKVLS